MFLRITNNLTKMTYDLRGIEDKKTSKLFYVLDVRVPSINIEEGEYTYELFDDEEKVIAQGLLQYGDYKRDENVNTEYNDNNNGYIVYDGK